MFGVGLPELFLILLIALLVFGPDKLPEVARTLGRLSSELKKATDMARREFYNSVYSPAEEVRRRANNELRTLTATPPPEEKKEEKTLPEPIQNEATEKTPSEEKAQ